MCRAVLTTRRSPSRAFRDYRRTKSCHAFCSVVRSVIFRPYRQCNSLRGSGGGLNPLGKLRSATGVDRLRILGPDDTNGRGTALAAGQYLTDDIYVEFITDARGFTATQLEVSLTPFLSILSQAGGSGATNVNVRYRKNY